MSNRVRTVASRVPVFLDDSEMERARNGTEANGSLVSREITLLNQAAYAGYPAYTMISREFELQAEDFVRQVYFTQNFGAEFEDTVAIFTVATTEGGGESQEGQGIETSIGGTDYLMHINSFPDAAEPGPYPENARLQGQASNDGYDATPREVTFTSATTNGPDIHALFFGQAPAPTADTETTSAYVGSVDVHAKGEIVGAHTSSPESLQYFMLTYVNTHKYMRPQFGWSSKDGTYVDFTTSKTNFRYIFDQTYGTGGTTMSATTPAATLPLMYSASGRRTQVRVYVFVYAAMSGATNTGSIGVANRNASGTSASAPSAITNTPTISGTTFAWYPTLASWNKNTSPYFLGYAGTVVDRVALCAKSSGSTDSVRIGAFTFVVMNET